jgi:flagellar biosynthesis protein FlhB
MKPWSRIAGVIACALGTVSSLQGLPEIFRERSIVNIILSVAILFVQIWIGYFLLQPSTRELFVQAQGTDERVLKI